MRSTFAILKHDRMKSIGYCGLKKRVIARTFFLQVVEQKEPHSSASTSGNSFKITYLKKLAILSLTKAGYSKNTMLKRNLEVTACKITL
jgi:hypothetical protein